MADLILIDRGGNEHPVKLFCKPGHFYSPLPDTERFGDPAWLARVFTERPPEMPGIDWRPEAQLELLDRFGEQAPLEFPTERPDPVTHYWSRSRMYPALDAWMLQAFVRHLKPARVVDVGAGHSSLVTARVNRELLDGRVRHTAIDPFPPDALKDGVDGLIELRTEEVQNTPLDVFETLAENDLLFIDTSHVAKTGGDVPWIYNQILPRLRPGVVVHIHDVFMPGEYPENWVLEGRAWNEQYLVQAFLAFNSAFEVLLGTYWLRTDHWERLRRIFPDLGDEHRDRGSSLWIRRV